MSDFLTLSHKNRIPRIPLIATLKERYAYLRMVYTDSKHFESIYFDVWNSFKDHGGSKQSIVGLPYMAKRAIFDHVMDAL